MIPLMAAITQHHRLRVTPLPTLPTMQRLTFEKPLKISPIIFDRQRVVPQYMN